MGGSQPEFNKIKVDYPLFYLLFRMDRFAHVWLHATLSRGIQDWYPLERVEYALAYSKFFNSMFNIHKLKNIESLIQ